MPHTLNKYSILIVLLLLCGRSAVLAHSIEHGIHEDAEHCEICIVADQQADALVGGFCFESRALLPIDPSCPLDSVDLASYYSPHSSRAPPANF